MAQKLFRGRITFRIEGELLDTSGESYSPLVDTHYQAEINAQHGMSGNDLLSGWVIRSIDGNEVLLASYDDRLVQSMLQLIVRATDVKDRLYDRLWRLLLKKVKGDPLEGPQERQQGDRGPVRLTAERAMQRHVPGKLSPHERPAR